MKREHQNEHKINDQCVQNSHKHFYPDYIDKLIFIKNFKQTVNPTRPRGRTAFRPISGINKPKIFIPFMKNVPNLMCPPEPSKTKEKSKISVQIEEISKEVIKSVGEFNPDVDPNIIEKLQNRISKRAQQGALWENMKKLVENFNQLSDSAKEQLLKTHLMCNPSINQETDYLDPISFEEIQETETLLSSTKFSFDCDNSNAIFHILKAIAHKRGLEFVIRNQNHPSISKDSTNKLIDFALTNEIITEDSLFLLGSERPEHLFKGFTLTLNDNYEIYKKDPKKLKEFSKTTKEKIAKAFKVDPSQVIIFSFSSGSTNINYGVQNYDPQVIPNLESNYRKSFSNFKYSEVHKSFEFMEVSASSFDPKWNIDYIDGSNCPYNEKRGGYEYFPPKGFFRYGLNVSGKFDNGNDIWLGMSNVKGEWAVVYHGTAYNSIKEILKTPLRPGGANVHGIGIYCTPKVEEAAEYCKELYTLDSPNDQSISFQYVLMCRVNVKKVHNCTEIPCPDAESKDYTVHMTTREDYWFANLNNTEYENIRCYGVLVRQVEE